MSDHELLQAYARDQAQTAFATLVERHLNLVYSAARRQVPSAHLAEEIAQSVFIELARSAAKIPAAQPLPAWLYVVTRRIALNARRQESRRLVRETAAAEIAAMKTPPESWPRIAAVLDDAMDTLSDIERSAVVLRFFENQSLREVGASLGISEDTAQKRVSRGLDHLRAFLDCRGVAVTTAGLATDLSAHATQSAPAALGAIISTSTALSGAATAIATLEGVKTIAMTTIQKSLVGATLALVLGTGVYEAMAFMRQRSDLVAQKRQAASLTAQLRRVREQEDTALLRLKSAEAQIDSRLANASSDAALESRLRGWQANLDQLRQAFRQRPNLAIPELQLLSNGDWFDAATKAKLDSDDGLRQTLARLRGQATNLMGDKMRAALNAYLQASGGMLPDHLPQLMPYFNPPIEPVLLERYELLRTGKLSALSDREQADVIGLKSFGDVEYDQELKFGPRGFSEGNAMDQNVHLAMLAFRAAGNVQRYTAAALVPYLKWPASEAAVQKILDAQNARARR